jgi:hypothetical protein
MKKFSTTLLILLSFIQLSFSQTKHPWELGFNGGASWLQSDVKMKKLGGGLGFTFGQMYCQNQTGAIDWGWRFRYLNANTYGQDSKRTSGLLYNNALNGAIDTAVDYEANPGFVYQNYKTHIDEVSVEVLLGANRLRERTHVYPYIFGGVGLTKAVAKSDQLNANGFRYNYLAVDSAMTLSSGEITSKLNELYDGEYETFADGSRSARWKFMPSVGVGLGFEIVKGFSLGLEHKMTWALNDVIDGQQWTNSNLATGDNDKYHYSSVWLKFSFGRGAKTTNSTNSDANNYTNNNSNNTNNNTNNNNTNNTNNINTNTAVAKPKITFTNPSGSGTSTDQQNYTVTATVTGVNSISDITFKVNGNPINGFTYNSASGLFSCPVSLYTGHNSFVITATNSGGSVNNSASVTYNPPATPVLLPPVVQITAPSQSPSNTNQAVVTVSGTVQGIASGTDMQVTLNGNSINSYTYNTVSKTFNITGNLVAGANTFVISAANPAGSDSETVVIIYQTASAFSGPAPVINIITPAANPSNVSVNSAAVTANVQNVSNASQITVNVNGGNIPFNFNSGTKQLGFTANLNSGANNVVISATNSNGSDTKSRTIIYTPVSEPKPVITITNPPSNPSNSSVAAMIVNATVMNVTSKGQISATLNGGNVMTSALNFDPATHQLSFNVNLIPGANSVQISATNVSGADSKSTTIIYNAPAVTPAPVVTITNPATTPFNTTMNSLPVSATVTNVNNSSQVSVMLNGSPVPFNFNSASHVLSFTAALINGSNTISVTATNTGGTDTENAVIIVSQPVVLPAPIVTILNPPTSPFNTGTALSVVNASVMNVAAASQITVQLNGSNVPFNFNASTHQLTFNATLLAGSNIVSISAVNPAGSDSKTATIIYTAANVVPAPVVTITGPSSNPFSTSSTPGAVSATVMNVTAASQISVTLNGNTVPFTFNPVSKVVNLSPSLIAGANIISVTATNSTGSDSKSTTIIYTAPAPALPPVITITSPTANPFNTSANTAALTATVMNVTAASQITVSLNGSNTPFTFNPVSHVLNLNANLVAGANSIAIMATNSAGSDTKATTIIYTAPAPVLPPVVTITDPTANPHIISQLNYTLKAKVLNITNASQIQVYQNNNLITTYTYIAATKMLTIPAALKTGANWFKIRATNSAGKDSATVTIKVIQTNPTGTTDTVNNQGPAKPGKGIISGGNIGGAIGGGAGAGSGTGTTAGSTGSTGTSTGTSAGPEITLVNPATTTVTTTDAIFNLTATMNVASQSYIVIKVNGVPFTGFSYNKVSKNLFAPIPLITGSNSVTIEATNTSGTTTKTIIITKN